MAFKSSGDEDLNLSEESEKDYDERGAQNSDISEELNSGFSSVGASEIFIDSPDSDFGFNDTVATSGSKNEVSDFDEVQSFKEKIAFWSTKNNLTKSSIAGLLKILRKCYLPSAN